MSSRIICVTCEAESYNDQFAMLVCWNCYKKLRDELKTANEKCRQYEQLILDNANKNI
jgi:hypothetical protein